MLFYLIRFLNATSILLDRYLKSAATHQETVGFQFASISFRFEKFLNEKMALSIPLSREMIIVTAFFLLLIIVHYRIKSGIPLQKLALETIALGALSNLYDRIVYGAVIDYISIQISVIAIPIFNIADVFVVGGCLILLYSLLKEKPVA